MMRDDERMDENKEIKKNWDFRELEDVEAEKKALVSGRTDGEDIGNPDKTESGRNTDIVSAKAPDAGADASQKDDRQDEYEEVCFICRRPESKAGKMFKLPNHICVCNDCMHKTMDTVSQFDYQGMLNNPGNLGGNMGDFSNGKGFPNISFVNLADLQGEEKSKGKCAGH